jgi:hypothetical protein
LTFFAGNLNLNIAVHLQRPFPPLLAAGPFRLSTLPTSPLQARSLLQQKSDFFIIIVIIIISSSSSNITTKCRGKSFELPVSPQYNEEEERIAFVFATS